MRPKKGKSLVQFPNDFVVIDIETTGLDSRYDEIIELSAIKVHGNQVSEQFSSLVKPRFEVPGFITGLTGISNTALENAPRIEEVLSDYMHFLSDDIIVGHNVNFDINFLYDTNQKVTTNHFSNDFVDTLRLARFLLRELNHHRLADLSLYYGMSDKVEHRGLSDAAVTLDIFNQLHSTALKRFETVEQLVDAFRRQANHPHAGLKAHSISTDKTNFDITHPLYNKACVFTGTLKNMTRKEAFQTVVDYGGNIQDSITNDTNYLIVGSFDYSSGVKGGKSSKLKKAEDMILKGKDIEILSENVFYDMLE